jgi:tRNA threonylcarbamoyladenosine modification (KEOPS) complex  Pcc1 subunit
LAPQTPKELAELIHHCLEFHAKNRPARISDAQAVLEQIAVKVVVTADDSLENLEW